MGGDGESHGALVGYVVPRASEEIQCCPARSVRRSHEQIFTWQLQLQRERLGAVAGDAIRRDAEGADGGAFKAPTVKASGVDVSMDLRTHMPVWLEAFRPVRNNET